jgi:transcriptional regulator with XRE-family HTH domain
MARAIRRFRAALGDTQQQFAVRTGLSVTSIARYETGWHPRPAVLRQFVTIAEEAQLPAYSAIFERALPEDPGLFLDEIPALRQLIFRTTHELDPSKTSWRRLRLALACLQVPDSMLAPAEKALTSQIEASEQSIERTAGDVVISRRPESEAAYVEFLRSPTEETAMRYLEALDPEHHHQFQYQDKFRAILTSDGIEAATAYLQQERSEVDEEHLTDEAFYARRGQKHPGESKPLSSTPPTATKTKTSN